MRRPSRGRTFPSTLSNRRICRVRPPDSGRVTEDQVAGSRRRRCWRGRRIRPGCFCGRPRTRRHKLRARGDGHWTGPGRRSPRAPSATRRVLGGSRHPVPAPPLGGEPVPPRHLWGEYAVVGTADMKPVSLGNGGQRQRGGEERMARRRGSARCAGLKQVTRASFTPIVALHLADS